jgi:hypothetical protein
MHASLSQTYLSNQIYWLVFRRVLTQISADCRNQTKLNFAELKDSYLNCGCGGLEHATQPKTPQT